MRALTNKNTSILFRLLISLLIAVGYLLMTLPYMMDQVSRIKQTSTIAGYAKAVAELDDNDIKIAWQNCDEYNNKIAKQHSEAFYHYSDDTDYSQDYLLLPFTGANEIATIEIPKIDVNLPVGHGTDEETLQTMVGHLYGTSFPSGGESTHTVLSAHTALRTSKMFDRLGELTLGDEIYLTVLNETHIYTVIDTLIIEPKEHDRYLQVEPGKDLLTLYTCYPYGINTHRLLVKAERTGDVEPIKEENTVVSVENNLFKPVFSLIGMLAILIALEIGANKLMDTPKKAREKV